MRHKILVTLAMSALALSTLTTTANAATTSSSSSSSATNPVSHVQKKLNQRLKTAQKWAEKQTQNLLASSPSQPVTQGRAVSQLLAVFNKVPSWPTGLMPYSAGDPTGTTWINGKTKVYKNPNQQWIGLGCVFPGEPYSKYASLLGIAPTNATGTVTASQLSQWIVNWEETARQVDLSLEPTQNPFQLLKLFSFFYQTDITGPNSVVTRKDMSAIRNNILEVSRGWRLLEKNKLQVLAPLQELGYGDSRGGFLDLVKLHKFNASDWPNVYGQLVKAQDTATFTFEKNGNVVYQYQKGTGYVPEAGGAFLNKGGNVISSFAWEGYYYALAYKEDKPTLRVQVFNEPSPEIFNWHLHVPTTKQALGYSLPRTTQYVFVQLEGDMVNRYCAANGLALLFTPDLAVGYTDGVVKWAQWTYPAAINYPSEAMTLA